VLTVFGKNDKFTSAKLFGRKECVILLDTHLWWVASEIHFIVTGHFVEI